MLTGKSISHVNQGVGKIYSKSDIKGYYNDLTEKVTKDENFEKMILPIHTSKEGEEVEFSIEIFQYGLGAYDLYLLEKKRVYLEKFKQAIDWAIKNQLENGAWITFAHRHPEAPFSAMAQGEGISLLLRGYKEFGEEKYLNSAHKAISFMLLPLEKGGTTLYKENDEIFLKEYTHKPIVLNGWIFAIFGLYDYVKITKNERVDFVLKYTLNTLKKNLKYFDNGYWSKYDIENMITSPFYHKLHIAQLEVLFEITNDQIFKEYAIKWENYRNKWLNRNKAFIVKALQKLTE